MTETPTTSAQDVFRHLSSEDTTVIKTLLAAPQIARAKLWETSVPGHQFDFLKDSWHKNPHLLHHARASHRYDHVMNRRLQINGILSSTIFVPYSPLDVMEVADGLAGLASSSLQLIRSGSGKWRVGLFDIGSSNAKSHTSPLVAAVDVLCQVAISPQAVA